MAREVTVVVHKNGQVQVETAGFTGEKCYDVTKQLGLGVVTEDEKKSEYHEQEIEVVPVYRN